MSTIEEMKKRAMAEADFGQWLTTIDKEYSTVRRVAATLQKSISKRLEWQLDGLAKPSIDQCAMLDEMSASMNGLMRSEYCLPSNECWLERIHNKHLRKES